MKKNISVRISAGIFFLVLIGTFSTIAEGIGDVDVIKQRMMSLGFLENINSVPGYPTP